MNTGCKLEDYSLIPKSGLCVACGTSHRGAYDARKSHDGASRWISAVPSLQLPELPLATYTSGASQTWEKAPACPAGLRNLNALSGRAYVWLQEPRKLGRGDGRDPPSFCLVCSVLTDCTIPRVFIFPTLPFQRTPSSRSRRLTCFPIRRSVSPPRVSWCSTWILADRPFARSLTHHPNEDE
ncbi:hypothetical protein LX36DRAFT_172871 [Colletotrichum falcatum]|nr:hypothetical protein LX36DRAFT_172871 [Colletotrichum falcatum]